MEHEKFLTGKENFQREATETKRGEWFKFKLGGETYIPGGSSFYLGGAVFQRGRYWGVLLRNFSDKNATIPIIANMLPNLYS